MNENLYIAYKKKTSTQNLACSQRQIHTVHTRNLSQAKTTKGHALNNYTHVRAQELCESRGGRPRLPVPNVPHCLCERTAALNTLVCAGVCVYVCAYTYLEQPPRTRFCAV